MLSNQPRTEEENKKRRKVLIWFFSSFIVTLSLALILVLSLRQDSNDAFIKINEAAYLLEEGNSALVTFEASSNLGSFLYTSNDSTVVQFIENRLVTVGPGSTTITVSSQSNPSVFQTVSVIVRERLIQPEVPVEPELPVEPEPEVPVEPEPPVEPVAPEPEVPVAPEPEEEVVTPPTIFTVTITNETGAVITTLEVEEGSFITTSSLDLPELFKGFFLEGETCTDDPFDLETPITEDLTLIEASFNDEAPCLQLESIVLSGRPVAGTTLTVDIFPIGANVTISWYTSVNNRTYREIPGESSSTFTVRPEDSGKFIRVYVVSDSNPPVVRYDTIKLDVFGTVSSSMPDAQIQAIIDQGFIPISSPEDLLGMTANTIRTFGSGTPYQVVTSGGMNKSYVLVNDIDLASYPTWTSLGAFEGIFDGFNFTIRNGNLINHPNSQNIGFFQTLFLGFTIKNLILEDFVIENYPSSVSSDIGILAGNINANGQTGTIENVIISGGSITVSDDVSNVGSVAGYFSGSPNNNFNINQVFSTATITGSSLKNGLNVGGLFGKSDAPSSSLGFISEVFYHGTIYITRPNNSLLNIGGIMGAAKYIRISDSAVIADITVAFSSTYSAPNTRVGGIIGLNDTNGTLNTSYYVGHISFLGAGSVHTPAGIIGSNAGTIGNTVFWYNQDAIQHGFNLNTGTFNATGQGVLAFTQINTFNNWSISSQNTTTWTLGFNGLTTYPWLSWQNQPQPLQIINPYISLGYIPIASIEDLEAIESTASHTFASGTTFELVTNGGLNKNYVLVNDIDLSSILNWKPIGDYQTPFTGELRGNDFTISHLTINSSPSYIFTGLFSFLENAIVSDLTLNNFNITGNSSVGSLAGRSTSSTLNNLQFTNVSINGDSYVGGMIGLAASTSITDIVMTNTTVIGTSLSSLSIGGMIGEATNSTSITNSVMTNTMVSGHQDVGGLVGEANNITLSNTTMMSITVSGYERVGGMVGKAINTTLSNSAINHLTVMSSFYAMGGLIGDALSTTLFQSTISNATLSGVNAVGGLIGASELTTLSNNVIIDTEVLGVDWIGGMLGLAYRTNLSNSAIVNSLVTGTSDVGGMVGQMGISSLIQNSYSLATVAGVNSVGGMVGRLFSPSAIFDSYVASHVTGSEGSTGGLVGSINDLSVITFTAIYTNSDVASGMRAIGFVHAGATTSGSITAITTSQMQDSNTFTSWDFNHVWAMSSQLNEGYPYLRRAVDQYPSQILLENRVVHIDAADPSSYASFTLNEGITLTTITHTSVFSFNGTSGFIDLGEPIDANTSFTFEAWVYDQFGDFNRNIISSRNTVFFIGTTTLYGGIGGAFTLTVSMDFPKNVWRHVVLTLDDPLNTVTMYINGVEVDSATTSNSFNGETLRAGSHVENNVPRSFWAGLINEFRIYNRSLTSQEVFFNYTATQHKYE